MAMYRIDLMFCNPKGGQAVTDARVFASAPTAAAARAIARQRVEDERQAALAGLEPAGWFQCEAPGVASPPRIAIRPHRVRNAM